MCYLTKKQTIVYVVKVSARRCLLKQSQVSALCYNHEVFHHGKVFTKENVALCGLT